MAYGLKTNILFEHGPLTAAYYTWGDRRTPPGEEPPTRGDSARTVKEGRNKYDFISEGDSPAFLHLMDVGLNNLEHPSYGGLGGRLIQSDSIPIRWEDGEKVQDYNPYTKKYERSYPQIRWLEHIQNEFAARADWCVNSYEEANHAPNVKIIGPEKFKVNPGDVIELKGEATDPDGDELTYHWWQYFEVGTSKDSVNIQSSNESIARITIPSTFKKGDSLHIILEVSDVGSPSLTRFGRVIIHQ